MSKRIFTPMEIDAIGEIMNISLGSSATAVSNMLDHRVDITTPKVMVVNAEDFTLEKLEPAIGVEIKYVTGLEGSNIMLLKMSDVKEITDILLGMDTPDEEFELNDLTLSAVCEVMNQMMGAASTALSDFLGRMVNISTPQTFDANDVSTVKAERLPVREGPIVVVSFALIIEDAVESEFMNVISVELAKELVSGFGLSSEDLEEEEEQEVESSVSSGAPMSQDEIEKLLGGGGDAPVAPQPQPQAPASSSAPMSQDEIEKLLGGGGGAPAAPQPQPQAPASSGAPMSQDEIEKLLGGSGGAPATPQPQPQAPAAAAAQPQTQGMGGAMPGMGTAQPGMMPGMGAMPMQAPMGAYPPYYGGFVGPDGQQYPFYPPMMGYWGMPPQPPKEEEKKREKPESKTIKTKAPPMPRLENGEELNEEQAQNLDLIMAVPLEVAVEIGRTRKKVKDILSLSKGSLVVLDKLAGDQVDVYVNGKCIAHGDVVVVDDNFGIRINEIVRRPGLEDLTK